jgi:hypothetical protein
MKNKNSALIIEKILYSYNEASRGSLDDMLIKKLNTLANNQNGVLVAKALIDSIFSKSKIELITKLIKCFFYDYFESSFGVSFIAHLLVVMR